MGNRRIGRRRLDTHFINLEKLETPDYVWCIAESEKHGLNFFSCAKNKHTMHCSGDHGF